MSKKLIGLALILSFAAVAFAVDLTPGLMAKHEALRSDWVAPEEGGSVAYFTSPPMADPNGWYWMYDNDLPNDPPFTDPVIAPIPTPGQFNNFWMSLPDSAGSKHPAASNDDPYKVQMPDSFWYYGYWYDEGDYIYISPDGWVSFDNPDGDDPHPDPPNQSPPFPYSGDEFSEIIAPLWQDMNGIQSEAVDPDYGVWYWYNTATRVFAVQWNHMYYHNSSNWYDFELQLQFGGQQRLVTAGACGVVFSYHWGHFLYNDCSPNWNANQLYEDGGTGIEDQTGHYGITYNDDELMDHRIIRWGYKRIFKHDVQAYAFISPGALVLRWTDIEPIVIVRNIGENAEDFSVTLDIYRTDNDSLVYHYNLAGFHLLPGEMDTLVGPCWTPEEVWDEYNKVCFTQLERDSCKSNDTIEVLSLVHCDDTFRYFWNWADQWALGWGIRPSMYFMTFYGVNNGVLVTGGQVYLYSLRTGSPPPMVGVWESVGGCGPADCASGPVGTATAETFQVGWNKAFFDEPGVFAHSADPGSIWAGSSSSSGSDFSGWYGAFGMDPFPPNDPPHPCWNHPGVSAGRGRGRGGYCNGNSFTWGHYGDEYSGFYTVPIELFVHLGFGDFPLSPQPSPPCYYDEPHDLTCYRMEEPDRDYVEADVPITPELAIANLGRAAEPYSGLFPVTFMVVDEETSDTVWRDSAMISHIGWLGDAGDNPDTIEVALPPWTPEGICRDVDEGGPFRYYELIGLVRLGEVGPDESDHCPYNDTVKNNVTCLLSHDVGVTDLTLDPGPDSPPDHYNAGTVISVTATVENFGYNEENNVPVHLEIRDVDSNDVLLWENVQSISFIDWRGNSLGNPYTAEVTFPDYTVVNEHHQTLTGFTELIGDMCPEDDYEVVHINSGIAEAAAGLPFALEAITPNPFVGATTISFAVPRTVAVSLKVYDITGKLVTTLVSGNQTPGRHSVRWNGTDDAGRTVAQGIYLVRMESENFSATKKVVLY